MLLVEVETGTPYLARFMVDAEHQGGGIGRRAVEMLLDELRSTGWSALETSFAPGHDRAAGFWGLCGFHATGRKLHGEPVVARASSRRSGEAPAAR